MKEFSKMLLIAAAIVLAFVPMFLAVHSRAKAFSDCIGEYSPLPETREQIIDYCFATVHRQ